MHEIKCGSKKTPQRYTISTSYFTLTYLPLYIEQTEHISTRKKIHYDGKDEEENRNKSGGSATQTIQYSK